MRLILFFFVVAGLHGQSLLLTEPTTEIDQAAALATERHRVRFLQVELLAANWTLRTGHPQPAVATAAPDSLLAGADFSDDFFAESAGLSEAAPFL